jgi:hypothetical protein
MNLNRHLCIYCAHLGLKYINLGFNLEMSHTRWGLGADGIQFV